MGDAEVAGDAVREPRARERFQARLDELVRNNRFTIAVVFPAVGALLLVGSAEGVVPEPLAYNPFAVLFGTLVMRLPLAAAVAPLVDRRSALALAAVAAYAYAIELVGVTTGWPYGEFTYGVALGPMLAGEVPLGLPVFFLPLVLDGYLLCLLTLGSRANTSWLLLPAAVGTVLVIDLVLDPAAAAIGFWSYAAGGPYYGVPASNYVGWLLSATVAVALLDAGFDRRALVERVESCPFALDDLVSFVLLWGAVNAVYLQVAPLAVAALLVAGLVRAGRLDFLAPSGRGTATVDDPNS